MRRTAFPLIVALVVAALLNLCAQDGPPITYADTAQTAPIAAPVTSVAAVNDTASIVGQVVDWVCGLLPESVAKIIGTLWLVLTTLGAFLTACATLIRLRWEGSRTAGLLDVIAHWLSVLGTSVRKSQVRPPSTPSQTS